MIETFLTDSNGKMRDLIKLFIENPIPEIIWMDQKNEKDCYNNLIGWDQKNEVRIIITPMGQDLIGIAYDLLHQNRFSCKREGIEIYQLIRNGIETNWQDSLRSTKDGN